MKSNLLRKGLVFTTIVLIIGASIVPFVGSRTTNITTNVGKAVFSDWPCDPDIIVPDDYPTIQEAIDYAEPGFCIGVRAGTYYENVFIDKENITLCGEDRDNTILDGSGKGDVIDIYHYDRVSISNFSMRNAGGLIQGFGISLYHSSNNYISDCTITDNKADGIYLFDSSNNSIQNCTITDNEGGGIYLLDSSNNSIQNCTITNNKIYGIVITSASNNNSIQNCTITNNKFDGISINLVSNNSIQNCTITDNEGDGISIDWASNNNSIQNCTITDNKADGIFLAKTSNNNSIQNCTITDNEGGGISIKESTNNIIISNFFTHDGITIRGDLEECIQRIENNTVNGKPLYYLLNQDEVTLDGIEIGQLIMVNCHDAIIRNLDISNTDYYGIQALYSSNNLFYLNKFHNNTVNAYDNGDNQWDNGSIGNWWDDYYGYDSNNDGIGDKPYEIYPYDVGNIDRYPTGKFNTENIPPEIIIKKPIEGVLYIFDKEIFPLFSGETKVFGKITIEVDVRDFDSGVYKIDFYIDDEIRDTEYYEIDKITYGFNLDDTKFGEKITIRIDATDIAGNISTEYFDIIIWNFRLPRPPG
jgi:parallel beta-helix repeat protein